MWTRSEIFVPEMMRWHGAQTAGAHQCRARVAAMTVTPPKIARRDPGASSFRPGPFPLADDTGLLLNTFCAASVTSAPGPAHSGLVPRLPLTMPEPGALWVFASAPNIL